MNGYRFAEHFLGAIVGAVAAVAFMLGSTAVGLSYIALLIGSAVFFANLDVE